MKKRKNKIRIYLILADENLFHPHFLTSLIKHLENKNHKIVGITTALDPYKHGFISAVLKQKDLWGLLPFMFIAINTVIRSLLFKFKIYENATIAGISKSNKIPYITSQNVNSDEHLKYLSSLKIDFIVSSNGQIFKNDLLNLPKIACINRHSALLPKYGGVLPFFWAMKNKEDLLGVSVHYMVEKIDKGSILSSESFRNEKNSSLFYNYMLAFDISARVATMAIESALTGKIMKKFTHNKNEYYSFPSKKEIKEFKKKNKTFLLGDIFKYYKMYYK